MPPSTFSAFVFELEQLLDTTDDEPTILDRGAAALAALVADDSWLPDSHAAAGAERYQQHLLHRDADGRFSVVSFVWGPGQRTPIHDHTVWGLVGVLRGAEISTRFDIGSDGRLRPVGAPEVVSPGSVDRVSPTVGDIHEVANALEDDVSISIHVYGADIERLGSSVYRIYDELALAG
jgi:3-mercaptopropionate dioxygenase